ncbi:MAG: DEAD/DEAH box helicase [Verrucomicrobiota bacterium]
MTGFEALQQLRLPDAWQAEAIRALDAGEDVIVQAPTGAGKTFIFEQYFQQRRGPGQLIFTVPTRALANDKFAEWSRRGWRVGITTGDLAHDADAPLVVATLEAQQTPAHAALYVIDEYQWLADPLRGNHYEGTILALPSQTQLLLLSGSVANPGAVRDWLVRLDRGRRVTLIEQRERPVPLDEVEIDSLARNVPESITGYWTRRIAGALRDDLGPILVFAPHRKEAEKIARDVAVRIPCPQPLRLTKDQENAAGPDLARLLGPARRVSPQRPQLRAARGAGRAAGQGRAAARGRGHAGPERGDQLFAALRARHGDQLHRGRPAPRGDAAGPAADVRPRGPARPRRPGLRAGQRALAAARPGARAGHLRRSTPLPWRPLLQALARGGPIEQVSADFQRRLFTAENHPAGHRVDAQDPRAAALRSAHRRGPRAAGAPHEGPGAVLLHLPAPRGVPRAGSEAGAALALEPRRHPRQAPAAHAARGASWRASPARRVSVCLRAWRTKNIRWPTCSRTWRTSSLATASAAPSRAGAGGSRTPARRPTAASPARVSWSTGCR